MEFYQVIFLGIFILVIFWVYYKKDLEKLQDQGRQDLRNGNSIRVSRSVQVNYGEDSDRRDFSVGRYLPTGSSQSYNLTNARPRNLQNGYNTTTGAFLSSVPHADGKQPSRILTQHPEKYSSGSGYYPSHVVSSNTSAPSQADKPDEIYKGFINYDKDYRDWSKKANGMLLDYPTSLPNGGQASMVSNPPLDTWSLSLLYDLPTGKSDATIKGSAYENSRGRERFNGTTAYSSDDPMNGQAIGRKSRQRRLLEKNSDRNTKNLPGTRKREARDSQSVDDLEKEASKPKMRRGDDLQDVDRGDPFNSQDSEVNLQAENEAARPIMPDTNLPDVDSTNDMQVEDKVADPVILNMNFLDSNSIDNIQVGNEMVPLAMLDTNSQVFDNIQIHNEVTPPVLPNISSASLTTATKNVNEVRERKDTAKMKLVAYSEVLAKKYQEFRQNTALVAEIDQKVLRVEDLKKKLSAISPQEHYEYFIQPTDCHNTTCVTCKNCCHRECGLPEDKNEGSEIFKRCTAFSTGNPLSPNECCLRCTHSYKSHIHLRHIYVKEKRTIYPGADALSRAIRQALWDPQLTLRSSLENEIRSLTTELQGLTNQVVNEVKIMQSSSDYNGVIDNVINSLNEKISDAQNQNNRDSLIAVRDLIRSSQ